MLLGMGNPLQLYHTVYRKSLLTNYQDLQLCMLGYRGRQLLQSF